MVRVSFNLATGINQLKCRARASVGEHLNYILQLPENWQPPDHPLRKTSLLSHSKWKYPLDSPSNLLFLFFVGQRFLQCFSVFTFSWIRCRFGCPLHNSDESILSFLIQPLGGSLVCGSMGGWVAKYWFVLTCQFIRPSSVHICDGRPLLFLDSICLSPRVCGRGYAFLWWHHYL